MTRRSAPFRPPVARVILSALLLLMVLFIFLPGFNSVQRDTASQPIGVHRGTGFRTIVDTLHQAGVIRFRWPLLVAGALVPGLHNIKPGRYVIPGNLSTIGILRFLHSRPQDEVRLMIPNGVEQTKIASILASGLDIDSTAFMVASRDPLLLRSLGIRANSTEGYLFPGTYHFAWASTPQEVITFLAGHFRKFYSDSLKAEASNAGFNELRLLTLASIVEAETPIDAEKPLIASVYLNRLKKNMRLQADPTVQYALAGDARRLSYKDLDIDSPYNTYRHAGLPPGPICNPGPASISAVLNPASTGYLYFVATGRGGHTFASNLADHARNVRNYRVAREKTQRNSGSGTPR
ncbi:MAG: endolytic transglycosylase MltG [Chlorobiaceae bacterium]|nr:endolytic transglycosylase MltG [Chlorobiaceae bacterium]